MTKPWHMARVASRRPLPKPRKMMAPVGPQVSIGKLDPVNEDTAHICCGHHVCSCEEDDRPFMDFTLAECEKMDRIGGTAGYLEVCRDRMAAISGLNSVARGEPKPDPEAQAEPKPFTEAFDQKIKTIMQSAELYLTAINLGIDPSTLPGVETKPYSITQSDGVEQKIIPPEQPKPEPIGRNYKFPVQCGVESGQAYVLKHASSFDDHARHATEHALLAERLGYCGLCHSREHKVAECPTMKAYLDAFGMWR